MRLLLDRRHHLQERLHISRGDTAADRVLESGEVAVDAFRDLQPFRRRRNHERAAIRGADLAPDVAAIRQPIENAGQRRALVGEAAVQFGDRRRRGGREQREDVRLALRQPVVTQVGEVEADPVRRAVNGRDQT